MTMQITGLVSGLDINSLIEQLIAIERRPLVQLQERIADLDYEKGVWRDINTRLKNLDSKLGTLKLESTYSSMTVGSSDENVVTASASGDAVAGTYSITVQTLASKHQYTSQRFADIYGELGITGDILIEANVEQDDGSLAPETFTITIESTDSLVTVMEKINNLDAPISANIIDNTLFVESTREGPDGQFTITDNTASFGFTNTQAGSQGSLVINGTTTVAIDSNTVEDLIYGVTLNLKDTGDTVITVDADLDSTVEAVQAFIAQYNSVISYIQEKTAKEAVLQGDGTAIRLENSLREYAYSPITNSGPYEYLSEIGISTQDESGKLEVDTGKLKKALQKDPLAAQKLFYDDSSGVEQGLVVEMHDYIEMYIEYGTGILSEKEKTIESTIEDINDQIERLEERVAMKEERLIAQYTAMETALSSLQNQSVWLSGQLASISSFNWSGSSD